MGTSCLDSPPKVGGRRGNEGRWQQGARSAAD